MSTSGRTGVLAAAVGSFARSARLGAGLAQGLCCRAGAGGRGAAILPLAAGCGDGRRRAQPRSRPRTGSLASGRVDGDLRRACLDFSRPAVGARRVARAGCPVLRISSDVLAHSARRRAGARPHPHRQSRGLRGGGGSQARRRAHGDRGHERGRHAARQGSAPRAGHHAQDAERRRRRLCRAQGAAPAAVARDAAGRV